ncbi:hypothetical protein DFH07DRAFT_961600 [Mycena maculata]|uniref:Uncharacterized protein n=1 Tax=Mycena maculata TaxID=230809 RepID=A0AAD7IV56_9AGAR|nr:hypothetical protein DFH07DRAFT_961600 [Mycena maculata]
MDVLGSGGYYDSQTSDTQFFGFSDSQSTSHIPEESFKGFSQYDPELDSGFSQPVETDTFMPPLPPARQSMNPADLRLLEAYVDWRPSGTKFPILKNWETKESNRAQIHGPLIRRRLGLSDPLTRNERQLSDDFIEACSHSAVSGGRDPTRGPNAMEVEFLAILGRISEAIPLIARLTMEGRWNDAKAAVDDTSLNLDLIATLHCVGRLVDDEVNPELSAEEVERRNFD